MIKTILKTILKKISRIIYKSYRFLYLLKPEEFNNPNQFGIYKLLENQKDKEIFDTLSSQIKKSVIFKGENYEIKKYAAELALSKEDDESNLYKLEFGVWKGSSANYFSKYFNKLYAFDSFEGLPNDWGGSLPKGSFNLNKKIPKLRKNVIPICGYVEDTLSNFLKKNNPKISFVHMDLDLYGPTKYVLSKIKPYLIKGAVILFDELYNYINWKEGEYKALIESFEDHEFDYKAFRINGYQVVIQIK